MIPNNDDIILKNIAIEIKKIHRKIQFANHKSKKNTLIKTYELGQAYFKIKKIKKALSLYKSYIHTDFKSGKITFFEAIPFIRFQAIFLRLLGRYSDSEKILITYIPLLKRTAQWDELGNFYGNLALINTQRAQYTYANMYHRKAIYYHSKLKHSFTKYKISANYCQMAKIALLIRKYGLAKKYLAMSGRKSVSPDSLANIYYLQSVQYLYAKRYSVTESALLKALFYAKKTDNYSLIRVIWFTLSEIKLRQHSMQEFLKYKHLVKDLDSLFKG